jgi:hypothetical protein
MFQWDIIIKQITKIYKYINLLNIVHFMIGKFYLIECKVIRYYFEKKGLEYLIKSEVKFRNSFGNTKNKNMY